MNRPSRTDDDCEHPTWNQNPPYLAADLTTCEDLNGIANSRELRNCPGGSGGSALGMDERAGMFLNMKVDDNGAYTAGPKPSAKMSLGLFVQKHLCRPAGAGTASSTVLRWIVWLASVLATSTLLSAYRPGLSSVSPFHVHGDDDGVTGNPSGNPIGRPIHHHHYHQYHPEQPASVAAVVLSSSPLAKRADACQSGGASADEYNMALHVGALVIILCVSGGACAFPMLARRFPRLRIPEGFFFAVRHFGTGVLIATAFVHLLPTAFISLGDPCLSGFWTSDYPAMPGAIALAGIFFVAVIEMVFSPARYFSPGGSGHATSAGDQPATVHSPSLRQEGGGVIEDMSSQPAVMVGVHVDVGPTNGPIHGRRGSIAMQLNRLSGASEAVEGVGAAAAAESESGKRIAASNSDLEMAAFDHVRDLSPEQKVQKQILQCMMLEVGILFHSVFIGMALSVAVGTNFIVLLVAIAFHQTFEGLALGARIASIDWPEDSYRPWLMDLAYGLTTPLGQAIGLATHTLYNPNSSFGLVLVGTMNAISSGLLVYASLVELLSEDLLSDESWRILRGKKRVAACLLVFAGAFCMSLVGAWA